MFLNKEELKTTAVPEVIKIITNNDDEIIQTVIQESIDEIKGYLSNYDVEIIFNAEDQERNQTVLKYLKKIVIYELYKRKSTQLDEDTISNFEQAMDWLEKVAAGKIKPFSLPPKMIDEDTEDSFLLLGSNKQYQNRF